MFKNLISLISGECNVIKFSDELFVYPIFKNGRSSLVLHAEEKKFIVYSNNKINDIKNITVYLRDPIERFVSGVNTFFYFKKIKEIDNELLKKIEEGVIVNKHFAPQYIWLLELYKFFRGTVNIRSSKEVYDLVPNRDGPWSKNPYPWTPLSEDRKNKILSIDHNFYTTHDSILIQKYMNRTVPLEIIIKDMEIKNAMS
jgi:hypothetical protein